MYTLTDQGCHADGSLGRQHVRNVTADILTRLYRHHPRGGEGIDWHIVRHIVDALGGDPSDDAWEEIEALDWMNKECYDGTYFEFTFGDLVLMSDLNDEE